MSSLNRRSFIAAAAAWAATPAAAAVPASGEVDVVIVGAGAAGIAAARRVAAARQSFALLEASDHVGGRCITDLRTFGVPYDYGAHWIHLAKLNPIVALTPKTGWEVYSAPRGQRLRVGRRDAREGELEDFLAALVRSSRAIAEAARGKTDIAAARALPKDLGDWGPTIEFVLGPYSSAKDLAEVSAIDFSRAPERDADAFCRQGYGALLAKLAEGLPVSLSTPATRIEWVKGLEVQTTKGRLRARAAIVTVSTSVLAAGKIAFSPELPKRQLDAFDQLKLGSYDHIALELPGNPLALQRDELVFEQCDSARTAALLANVSGTDLCLVDVGGSFGRDLAAQGSAAMIAFATDWLARLYGSHVKSAVKRSHATRWNEEPWVLGAASVAAPGGDNARKVMMEPLRERVWFAGEAVHESLWGTVGGAWQSGERAAEAALRKIGALRDPNEPKQRRRR